MEQALAYYLRLSDEDINLKSNTAKDESNSIAAQRGLILRHIEQNPELCKMPQLEYCDDGYSGTNFERPAFQQMIELSKQGGINCIIVKDLSRFGRDYLEVGDYLEHIFPFLGIRFKSINDHYDSKNHDGKTIGMDIAFRNLIYDYYSKDLSSKVRTAMRTKQEKGEYLSCLPYGYKRSESNKHRMVVDAPAAQIVREIFDGVLAGKSSSDIAAALNDRGVPTPQEYKGVHRHDETVPQWTRSRITGIIRNIKYTGVMTTHKRESRQIRDKNQRRVPQEEWIVRENMHEAIISREIWDKANDMLSTRTNKGRTATEHTDRVFYCAHCGRKLQKSNGQDAYYYCPSAKFHSDSPCLALHLNRKEVEKTIAAALRLQLSFSEHSAKASQEKKQNDSMDCFREIQQVEKDAEQLQKKKLEQYEAYRGGQISRDDFLAIKEQITAQSDCLTEKKKSLEERYQKSLSSQQTQTDKEEDAKEAIRILDDFDAGIKEHLYEAVCRINVASNTQIDIEWTFPDLFAAEP